MNKDAKTRFRLIKFLVEQGVIVDTKNLVSFERKYGLYFSPKAVKYMNSPKYVLIYADPDKQQIALEPCEATTENAEEFVGETGRKYVRLSKRVYIDSMISILGDKVDGKAVSYVYYDDEVGCYVVDFSNPEIVPKRTRKKKNDVPQNAI